MSHKKIRVLHCPTFGAGHAGMLAKAERELGCDSVSISIEPVRYGFSIDQSWNPFKNQILSLLFKEFLRWPLLIYACVRADVVHYNFGQTIMPQWYGSKEPEQMRGLSKYLSYLYKAYVLALEHLDVRILKAIGKKIVVAYQGDDVRQGDYCRKNYEISAVDYVDEKYYSEVTDRNKRRIVAEIGRYADCIYGLNPDLLRVLPKEAKFVPYANVDISQIKYIGGGREKRRPLVIHAPTHREVKGTKFIQDAVERLLSEGVDFDFQLIEGYSHQEALKLYEEADILIDQLLIGWYGGLAVEFMAMGKAVICYIREEDLQFIPAEMSNDLPIINANPDSIYEVLKRHLLGDFEYLASLGLKSRKYVEKWHDPARIAQFHVDEYRSILADELKGGAG